MKIRHYVSSITQENDSVIVVIFKEKVSTETMKEYLDQAQKDWTEQGLPDKIPIHVLNNIRNQRFQNEFMMKFPVYDWKKNELKIHDEVTIDMPLLLSDVVKVESDSGI